MTKEFKEYLQNTKNEFVTAVHELNLSPAQRVPMENILIAFDQCRHKLEQAWYVGGWRGLFCYLSGLIKPPNLVKFQVRKNNLKIV